MYSNGYDQSALRTYTGDIRQWCRRLYVRRHRDTTPAHWAVARSQPHRYTNQSSLLLIQTSPLLSSHRDRYLESGVSFFPLLSGTCSSQGGSVAEPMLIVDPSFHHSLEFSWAMCCDLLSYLIMMQVRSIYYFWLACQSLSDSLKCPPTNKLLKTIHCGASHPLQLLDPTLQVWWTELEVHILSYILSGFIPASPANWAVLVLLKAGFFLWGFLPWCCHTVITVTLRHCDTVRDKMCVFTGWSGSRGVGVLVVVVDQMCLGVSLYPVSHCPLTTALLQVSCRAISPVTRDL